MHRFVFFLTSLSIFYIYNLSKFDEIELRRKLHATLYLNMNQFVFLIRIHEKNYNGRILKKSSLNHQLFCCTSIETIVDSKIDYRLGNAF